MQEIDPDAGQLLKHSSYLGAKQGLSMKTQPRPHGVHVTTNRKPADSIKQATLGTHGLENSRVHTGTNVKANNIGRSKGLSFADCTSAGSGAIDE